MSGLLSITASLCMVAVIVSYWLQVRSNVSTPNPATWFIWSVVSVMNSVSYLSVVQGSLLKALLSIIAAVGLCFIFLYALRTGRFNKVTSVEVISLSLAIAIGVVWKTTGNPILANLSLQIVLAISFYPTINGLLKRELREKILPWNLAVIAQLFQIASLIVDWKVSGGWIALAYPIINGVLGNGSVAALVYFQSRAKFAVEP